MTTEKSRFGRSIYSAAWYLQEYLVDYRAIMFFPGGLAMLQNNYIFCKRIYTITEQLSFLHGILQGYRAITFVQMDLQYNRELQFPEGGICMTTYLLCFM